MQCPSCRGDMTTTREDYHYTDSGLSSVVLQDTEVRRCSGCDEEEVVISAIEAVHKAIARRLASKPGRLAPEEIRFLRKQLGFSGTDLAAHMGVAPETVSRWENAAQDMGPVADRLLRLLAVTGEPVQDYAVEILRTVAMGDAAPMRLELPAGPNVRPLASSSFRVVASTSTVTGRGVELGAPWRVATQRTSTVGDCLGQVA